MRYEIIAKDWYKRRRPSPQLIPVSVEVLGFERITNHFCQMVVTYEDNSTKQLLSRVIYNPLTEQWTIDGMEVAVRVVE